MMLKPGFYLFMILLATCVYIYIYTCLYIQWNHPILDSMASGYGCPLFRGKGYLHEDMLNGIDAILLSSCTPTSIMRGLLYR